MSIIIKSFCNFISSLDALKNLRSLVDFLLVNWYIYCILLKFQNLYSLLQGVRIDEYLLIKFHYSRVYQINYE